MNNLAKRSTLHPTSLAIQLTQHIRKSMIGMSIEDQIECLFDLDRMLQEVTRETYEDAEERELLAPVPGDE